MSPPLLLALLLGCSKTPGSSSTAPDSSPSGLADVIGVETSGTDGDWNFSVTVQSPDEGCKQYAQWWEVVDTTGQALHYRRILMHSHADEQPFTRDGGPVAIAADQEVVVRAWMLPGGYGGQAMKGTPAAGFAVTELEGDWGAALSKVEPLPEDCAF